MTPGAGGFGPASGPASSAPGFVIETMVNAAGHAEGGPDAADKRRAVEEAALQGQLAAAAKRRKTGEAAGEGEGAGRGSVHEYKARQESV